MNVKKKKLGKGLDALLGSALKKTQPEEHASTESIAAAIAAAPTIALADKTPKDGQLVKLPVEWLQRGKYQPRRDIDQEALQELANSIKAQGVMQPIVVRPVSNAEKPAVRYEIIAGERRWRATQLAGLDTIPAVVREVGDDAAIAMALIENIQRENLNPIEEAVALQRLKDQFELTHQEVADAVGKSRVTVTNLLRLMSLTDEVRRMLERGDLEMGHARALLGLAENAQRDAAKSVADKGLSVRQTEALVRNMQQQPEANKTGKNAEPELNPDIRRLQTDLSEKIGVPVQVLHSNKGSGKLVLRYNSLDELDGILAHIR
ncbi:MAG TPA: ParB/RepB/Spo0J family partition protein [Pseudomonadales bacterium]|jgi:ParB family chromosome partitioning protein|nr:ParB/RepB/Spo0J family partition protein [Pseudomonadales bacterium]